MSTAGLISQPPARYASRPIAELPLQLRGRKIWHKSAPRKVIEAGFWSDRGDGWSLWARHLRQRNLGISQVAPRQVDHWLHWSAGEQNLELSELPARLRKIINRKRPRQWAREQVAALFVHLSRWRDEPDVALECLSWCYALPKLSGALDGNTWWDLLSRLLETTADSDAIAVEEHPVVHQLFAAELRLTLAYLFPELKPCRRQAAAGLQALAEGFDSLLSPDGEIYANQLDHLRPLVGCWTRSALICRHLKRGQWSNQMQAQFMACVDHAKRLLTGQGRQLLCRDAQRKWPTALLRRASAVAGKPRIRAANSDGHPPTSLVKVRLLSDGAFQSDATQYAVLRAGRKATQTILAVDHSAADVRLEFWVGEELLLGGVWKCDLKIAEAASQIEQGWEAVCWVSDKDVVYLELQAPFSGNLKVQRQVLLGRKRPFMFLNDVVLSHSAQAIDYRGSISFADGVTCYPAADTVEFMLTRQACQLLVLPLGLGEWKNSAAPGELAIRGSQIELATQHSGRAFCAPLFIDINPKKRDARHAFTWRQLTVAENRRIVPPDDAAGFRVQVGERQYLFYRSLASRGVRTVLGAHLASEFLASQISDDGELETLIEIE